MPKNSGEPFGHQEPTWFHHFVLIQQLT
jgi:hypothetical protein